MDLVAKKDYRLCWDGFAEIVAVNMLVARIPQSEVAMEWQDTNSRISVFVNKLPMCVVSSIIYLKSDVRVTGLPRLARSVQFDNELDVLLRTYMIIRPVL